MASFKGDSRYTFTEDVDDSHSDDSTDTTMCVRDKRAWFTQYYDEIEVVYNNYLEAGRAMFGGAFHQLGRIDDFANFIYKHMQPGSTISNC
jgi:hypothetical protein